MSRVAMCRECDEPLVCTFAFTAKEFVCVKCGRLYDWLEPDAADETPELLARVAEVKAEWQPIGEALIGNGVKLRDCEMCSNGGGQHRDHATTEELVAHDEALAWLVNRRSVAA